MLNISGVVITFNEEKKIARCIESMIGVVEEIVVLDSFSTDSTRQICEHYGVRFFQQKFSGYGKQKNDAVDLAKYDYILSLDADEVLSDELRDELIALKKSDSVEKAYYLRRRNFYRDHFVRFCGWYPDLKLRLFDRRFLRWNLNGVHETVQLPEGVKCPILKSDFFHYTYDSYQQHLSSAMKFASISAKQRCEKGMKPSMALAILKSVFRFFKTFFLKLGFLDGKYGFLISWVSAKYAFHKYFWN